MSSNFQVAPGTFLSTMDYSVLLPLDKGSVSFGQVLPGRATTITVAPVTRTNTEGPAILMGAYLSPEDREAQKKGLALVAHIERLMQTDEGFYDWFQEGFDEIESGHFVTFSEEG